MFSHSGPHDALNSIQLISDQPAQTMVTPKTTLTIESSTLANRFLRIQATAPVLLTGASRAGIISILGLPLHQRHTRVDNIEYECENDADKHIGDNQHECHGHAGPGLVGDDDADGEQ